MNDFVNLDLPKLAAQIADHDNCVVTHTVPDLDNLTSVYLIKKFIPTAKIVFHPIDKASFIPGIMVDINGGLIDHHKERGGFISSAKKVYYIIEQSDLTVQQYRSLVDYADRSDRAKLQSFELMAGSLIHIIYLLRDSIQPAELLSVFSYLADEVVFRQLSLNNMCDIEVLRKFPQYADPIIAANGTTIAKIYEQVELHPITGSNSKQDRIIAINKTKNNITRYQFQHFKNTAALIYYSSPQRVGILFQKGKTNLFNTENILVTLNTREPDNWTAKEDSIKLRSGKEAEVSTNLSDKELLNILVANKYF